MFLLYNLTKAESASKNAILRLRAATHGRSTEAEIRDIRDQATRPPERVKLGSLLAQIGREAGGVELDIERDQTRGKLISFE